MDQLWRKWRTDIVVISVILVLGITLRLINLTIIPVFGDEAIYLRWSQIMRAEPGLRFVPLSDGKQPLFMWVVIPFLKILNDPLVAGRLVSVLCGIGTMVGIYFVGWLLFLNKRIAYAASFIYAISPFAVFFDRLALADSMLSLFGVWTLVFAIITVKMTRLDSAMMAGFTLGGALLTKSPALFFALLTPVTLLLSKWPKKFKAKFNSSSIYLFLFSFTYIIGFAMYNILRLGTNFHMIRIRNKDYVYPITHLLESPRDPLIVFLKDILNYFWLLGPTVLIILVIFGVYSGLKNYKRETIILLAWSIIPILIVAEYSKTMTARYIYFSVPYLCIIAALYFGLEYSKKVKGVNLLHPKGGLGLHLGVISVLLIFFIAHALALDFQLIANPQAAALPRSERTGYLEEWTSGYGIKEIADYLIRYQRENSQRKLVVGTEGYFGTLPDGLQMYMNDNPEIIVIGVGIDLKEVPKSLMESKAAGNATFLVINNSRLKVDPQEIGLEAVAAYPKALRPVGSREYNLNGPQEVMYLFEVK